MEGEELYNRAFQARVPECQVVPTAMATCKMPSAACWNHWNGMGWGGFIDAPAATLPSPCPVSHDVQLVIDNILRLQCMAPEQAAKALKDTAAMQGPYEAFSLKQAFGLCCEARAMLEENDSKAELRVKEARELAQKSFEEALADDDELVSKSSLRARRAWRPLRDTEKEEVQKKRMAVQEEAQQILNVCTLLDEEVQLKQKSEPQTLPPAPPPLAGIAPVTSAPITTSPSRFPGLRALEDGDLRSCLNLSTTKSAKPMHRKLNRGRERTAIAVQREHFTGKVDFVDLSKVPTDLAKEHGLDFFCRTWLESKMAQHHPIAFNMLWTLDRNDEDDNRVSLLQFADEKRVVILRTHRTGTWLPEHVRQLLVHPLVCKICDGYSMKHKRKLQSTFGLEMKNNVSIFAMADERLGLKCHNVESIAKELGLESRGVQLQEDLLKCDWNQSSLTAEQRKGAVDFPFLLYTLWQRLSEISVPTAAVSNTGIFAIEPGWESQGIVLRHDGLFCQLCNAGPILSTEQMHGHIIGKRHQRKARPPETLEEMLLLPQHLQNQGIVTHDFCSSAAGRVGQREYFCQPCGCGPFHDIASVETHIAGRRHAEAAKKCGCPPVDATEPKAQKEKPQGKSSAAELLRREMALVGLCSLTPPDLSEVSSGCKSSSEAVEILRAMARVWGGTECPALETTTTTPSRSATRGVHPSASEILRRAVLEQLPHYRSSQGLVVAPSHKGRLGQALDLDQLGDYAKGVPNVMRRPSRQNAVNIQILQAPSEAARTQNLTPDANYSAALQTDVALARLLAQAAEEPETGEMPVSQKREMCAQFLEVGRCILDQTCPFAHCPSELFGHASSRSPKKRQAAYVQLLPDEHMAQQQAASARAYDRSTAAADDATLRRLLLANDSPSTARRW
ncbi:unnamed protein product [Symbiodinium microadriaticum]|nr:unnamed protein product [Symbiodinium microadriaticum]CAE7948740.1 unnamed protein product [Symbiodinium sp. KB8]